MLRSVLSNISLPAGAITWAVLLLVAGAAVAQQNQCVNNVPLRFKQIPSEVHPVQYLGARHNDTIPFPRYTSTVWNQLGRDEHFQGVQRFGRYLIVSGGIKRGTSRSQLIVVEMGTQSATGHWSVPSYGHDYTDPPSGDRIVHAIDIDLNRWHAGGIQMVGSVAAVPIWGDQGSTEVRFLDLGNPLASTQLPITIHRPQIKAGAVGLTRLPNNHYMTVIWDDSNLDFHYSNSTSLYGGFRSSYARVHKNAVVGGFQNGPCGFLGCGTYQGVNFVRDCNGTFYLIGTRNTEKVSPTAGPGKNFATLYKVEWPGSYTSAPTVTFVERRTFECPAGGVHGPLEDDQCNFGAGAGIYVQSPNTLSLYAISHWFHEGNDLFHFNEYAPFPGYCGDGICLSPESSASCPQDCGFGPCQGSGSFCMSDADCADVCTCGPPGAGFCYENACMCPE